MTSEKTFVVHVGNKIISVIRRFYSYKSASIFTILVGTLLTLYVLTPGHAMLSQPVISTMLRILPELGIITIGLTMLMISREFDLSIGSVLAFSSMIFVWSHELWGLDLILALFLALGLGCFAGALNGLITVKFGIPSLITTLAMMMWWRGLVLAISGGTPVAFHPEETCPAFKSILIGEIGGVPAQFIWFLVITAIFSLLLGYHRFGNRVCATGGNKEAARSMGINTDRTKIICFILVGLLAAFAGIIQTTRAAGSDARQGTGIELGAIAAVVIGGTSIFGGAGTILGTFFGIILMETVELGLLVMRAPAYWFQAFVGMILIIAVVLNLQIEKRRK